MYFVFYYFEIIILINNLYYFLITLYNYYKNKFESVLYFYTIKIWKKKLILLYIFISKYNIMKRLSSLMVKLQFLHLKVLTCKILFFSLTNPTSKMD